MHVAGNSDEWFYASMGINKERTDARGRATGSYLMSTKGNVTWSDKEGEPLDISVPRDQIFRWR